MPATQGEARPARIAGAAFILAKGGTINVAKIRDLYGVSRATATKDMLVLERALPLKRVKGVLSLL